MSGAIEVLTGTATHAILAESVTKLPDWIARRILDKWYPPETLAGGLEVSCPPDAAELRTGSQEMILKVGVENRLPFGVAIKHIEFDVSMNRDARVLTVHYSRHLELPKSSKTIVHFPIFQLSANQIRIIERWHDTLNLMLGKADMETCYHAQFSLSFNDVRCVPSVSQG
jgi:hypothetical protein